MKNLRSILWVGLALILFVNVQVWMTEFGREDAAAAAAAQQALERERRDNPLAAAVPAPAQPACAIPLEHRRRR